MTIEIRRKFQKDAEAYFMSKFENATKEDNEEHGDFIIELNKRLIGFEVYTPEENLSLSVKELKEDTKQFVKNENGKTLGEGFGGGLSPNRFVELVERALVNKSGQFNAKVNYSKVLIVRNLPGSFNFVSSFVSEYDNTPKISNPFCSAIFVEGGLQNHFINNPDAKFPLSVKEREDIWQHLNLKQSLDKRTKVKPASKTFVEKYSLFFYLLGVTLLIIGLLGFFTPHIFKNSATCFQTTVQLNNSIIANCGSITQYGGPGGPGGSVELNSKNIIIDGSIQANGGPSTFNGQVNVTCILNQSDINQAIISRIIYNTQCDSPEPWSIIAVIIALADFVLTHGHINQKQSEERIKKEENEK